MVRRRLLRAACDLHPSVKELALRSWETAMQAIQSIMIEQSGMVVT